MTPLELLEVYKQGFFPMAKTRDDDGFDIVAPYTRALLPIKNLHVPKRLRRKALQFPFIVTFDTAFDRVITSCADAQRRHEPNTWINDHIISLFLELHDMGIAHSVECWNADGALVGGLYGTTLGSTFCGESMFSAESDASKIALIHLCARLNATGFKLLDSQFRNPHLDQFGLYEIPQDDYVVLMRAGLGDAPNFNADIGEEWLVVRRFLENVLEQDRD
jgi:leucyl/phenylalanyl-tRNA--protein transferase